MTEPNYKRLASLIGARWNCGKTGNQESIDKHEESIEKIMDSSPSGSGIDSGTKLDLDRSKPDRLVFTTSFHHMNESGMYDGWTEHDVIVAPSLAFGFDVRITGRNRNQIKDYLSEVFHAWLSERSERSER